MNYKLANCIKKTFICLLSVILSTVFFNAKAISTSQAQDNLEDWNYYQNWTYDGALCCLDSSDAILDSRIEEIVYITDTGSKYHRSTCHYLNDSKHPITLSDAKANGYTACKVCHPHD